jgi:hypothetical protein
LRAFAFTDFKAAFAVADDSGGTGPTVIQLGLDDNLTLSGALKSQIQTDDFIL